MKQYLVVLSGGGDTFIKLVNEAVWEWINGDYSPDGDYASSYTEKVPEAVLEEARKYDMLEHFEDNELDITSGSYDNDRAMAAPGVEFESLKAAMQYAKQHSLDIEDTYEGYFY